MSESFLWFVNHLGSTFTLGTLHRKFQQLDDGMAGGVSIKRLSASHWCAWGIGHDHRVYIYIRLSDVPIRVPETTYENQRWSPIHGFSKASLLRSDRPAWSNEAGTIYRPPESIRLPSAHWVWEGDWLIDDNLRCEVVGIEGWQYAFDFPAVYTPEKHWNSFVRKRKWMRFRRFSAADKWARISDMEIVERSECFIDLSLGGFLLPGQPTGFLSIWAVTNNGQVFVRTEVSGDNPEGSCWQELQAMDREGIMNISVGASNLVWAVTWHGRALVRTEVTRNNIYGSGWLEVDPPDDNTKLMQISVGKNSVWALSRDGKVWFRKGTSGNEMSWSSESAAGVSWIEMIGEMSQITVSSDDQVFALDLNGTQIYYRTGVTPTDLTGKTWRLVSLSEDLTFLEQQGQLSVGPVCSCGDPHLSCSMHQDLLGSPASTPENMDSRAISSPNCSINSFNCPASSALSTSWECSHEDILNQQSGQVLLLPVEHQVSNPASAPSSWGDKNNSQFVCDNTLHSTLDLSTHDDNLSNWVRLSDVPSARAASVLSGQEESSLEVIAAGPDERNFENGVAKVQSVSPTKETICCSNTTETEKPASSAATGEVCGQSFSLSYSSVTQNSSVVFCDQQQKESVADSKTIVFPSSGGEICVDSFETTVVICDNLSEHHHSHSFQCNKLETCINVGDCAVKIPDSSSNGSNHVSQSRESLVKFPILPGVVGSDSSHSSIIPVSPAVLSNNVSRAGDNPVILPVIPSVVSSQVSQANNDNSIIPDSSSVFSGHVSQADNNPVILPVFPAVVSSQVLQSDDDTSIIPVSPAGANHQESQESPISISKSSTFDSNPITPFSSVIGSSHISHSNDCPTIAPSTQDVLSNNISHADEDNLDYSVSLAVFSHQISHTANNLANSATSSSNLQEKNTSKESFEDNVSETIITTNIDLVDGEYPMHTSSRPESRHSLLTNQFMEEDNFPSLESAETLDEICDFVTYLQSSDEETIESQEFLESSERGEETSQTDLGETVVKEQVLLTGSNGCLTAEPSLQTGDSTSTDDSLSDSAQSVVQATSTGSDVLPWTTVMQAQPRLYWKWLDASSCVIDDAARVVWLSEACTEGGRRTVTITKRVRDDILAKLRARNTREAGRFPNIHQAVGSTKWVKKAGMQMFQPGRKGCWIACRIELEQGTSEVTEGFFNILTQNSKKLLHKTQIALSDLLCVRTCSQPQDPCLWVVHTATTPQPILLRASSEADAADWIGCLSAANAATLNINSPLPSGSVWSSTASGDVFVGLAPQVKNADKMYWGQHGGHMMLVETGPSGITWALGFDKMPYVYNGGYGGAVNIGLHEMSYNLQKIVDHHKVFVYENQKWFPVVGWCSKGALQTDFHWQTETGHIVEAKEHVKLPSTKCQWVGDWAVDFSNPKGVDNNGWQYSANSHGPFHPQQHLRCSYRRRRWARHYRITVSGPWQDAGSLGLIDLSIQLDPVHSTTDPILVWAVGANGDVLYRNRVTLSNPKGQNWVHVATDLDKPFQSISVGGRYRVWGVASDGSAWFRPGVDPSRPAGTCWLQVVPPPPGNCQLLQVSVGASSVWAVDSGGNLWNRKHITPTFPEGTEWEFVANRVQKVSVGPLDQVWIVSHTAFSKNKLGPGVIYRRVGITADNPAGIDWSLVIGSGWSHVTVRGLCQLQPNNL